MTKQHLTAAEVEAARSDQNWGSLRWLASRELGNAQRLTLGRVRIGRGQANPRHCHPGCEEVLFLLSGRLEHTLGGEMVALMPGDTLSIPAGVYHNAVSVGEEDADMIVAYSSGTRDFQLEPSP